MPANTAPRRMLGCYGFSLATALLVASTAAAQSGLYLTNIFSPAPRELRQFLTRAQAAVAEERYSDAVQELGQILNTSDSDDFFLTSPGSTETQVSLKTQALALLGSMPPKGRKFYELQCGAEAKAALEEALTSGNLVLLTDVCRRYFHTKAGYEATLLLGRIQLDQGRPLAAAMTMKRIADVPQAAAQYDPELSIMLATCWAYAGQPEQAESVLIALKQRLPHAKIRLLDKEVALFDRDDGALAWLGSIVGNLRAAFAPAATEWVVYRGDEKRNAESIGGVPLLNFNWKLPTVNDPPDEQRVAQLFRQTKDRGEPMICALQPLVVHDYAIIRQPESNKLIGINLKRNARREWVFPPFDDNVAVQAARQAQTSRGPTTPVREQELKQRIWEDQAFGQVSSDGRQVYVLDDLSYAPMPNVNQNQFNVGRGGRAFPNPGWSKQTNLLVALDLQRQGYQVWAVGGTTGDNPALANAFFLGAPLPAAGQVFALAEFNGEIRLLCLDPRTGSLVWKQQLAVVETQLQDIALDRTRRLAAASPSLADGILVCPTSAGAAVAVDLTTRTLRWGYQYGRSDFIVSQQARFGSRVAPVTTDNGHWLDSTATIADGCVVLTPAESQQLHCLDLLTGQLKWPAQPRDDMLFVGCIHKGKIILIGKDRIKAIDLNDGTPAWSDLKLEGEACTGRGYYSEKFYFLPVTGQQLVKIDLEEGKVVAKAQTEVELGNLVCYQNQLISQSPLAVASFVLLSEQLQKQLEDRLAANGEDVDALSLKAQILLQEAKPDASLDLLRKASKLAPQDVAVRGLLVKVMLSLLRQDLESNLALTDELDKFVTDPSQRREVLRFRVQGLSRANRSWDAFQALLELADQELAADGAGATSRDLISIDRELSVRSDRWLQGQLHTLWRGADAALQGRMSAELKTRLEKASQSGTAAQLRMFLNLFGFHGLSDSARLALADKLIVSEAFLEAELLVGELLDAADPAIAGGARATLAALYEKAKRPELAARQYQALGAAFGDVVCREGLTGQALAQRAAENPAINAFLRLDWPLGQVDVKESDTTSNAGLMALQRLTFPIQLASFQGATPRGLRGTYDPQQNLIAIRGDFGQTLATASLRSADPNRRYQQPANNVLPGKANGHLVVVNLGTEVVAVDGLRSDRTDALLWRQDAIDLDANSQRTNIYTQQRTTNNPLAGTRYFSYDANGRVNFNVAPVQSVGFCYQRGRQLICVDPLTGQSLWERGPIAQQVEVFGDEELIFVADSTGDETLVLSAIDGTLLEKRKIDRAERRWATHGRRVLAWDQVGTVFKIRLYDAWKPGDDLWSRQVAQGSRGCVIDGEELALLEPNGQFTIISLATGEVRFAAPLEPETSLSWIQVIRSSDQYLLLASQENNDANAGVLVQPLNSAANLQVRMHGRIYAFHRATGKMQWQVPAFVAQHCLPADQPTESPLLLFLRNRTDSNNGGGNTKASVLALDRKSGRIVYENDNVSALAMSCDIVADPAKQTVTLAIFGQMAKSLTFQFTDRPTPPQPPAQTGPLASNSASQPPGTIDRSIGATLDLINRGLNPLPIGARFGPPAPPAPAPAPPAPR